MNSFRTISSNAFWSSPNYTARSVAASFFIHHRSRRRRRCIDKMADGLCLGGTETNCLVNSSVKSDEKLKNIEKLECGNNVDSVCGPISLAETQKSSNITVDNKSVSVTETTNNKSDGITVNRFVDKQKTPGLVGLPRTNLKQLRDMKMSEDTREKRRCTDRYDSSESSDSGVATLSCTDSSTTSSDASDPGSPYSPSSCDDNNPNGVAMPPSTQATAARNWPWNNNFVTKTTNNKVKRILAPELSISPIKKIRPNSEKPTTTDTISKKSANNGKCKTADVIQNEIKPQTKITGFFKSQLKPPNSLKRDLTNLVVRSTDFPKTRFDLKTNSNQNIDVRTLTPMPPLLKKVERKTAKVAPLVPISRKTSTNSRKANQPALPKKPVNIAPRTVETKRNPPPLIPKLSEIRSTDQPKITQSAVLLTAIRLPQQQIATQQTMMQQSQNVQAKTPTKMGPVYQLHAPVMPKLVQIPNILSKDTNIVMNNGQLARGIMNNGTHYFLNGAVIKLHQLPQTNSGNGQPNGLTTIEQLNSMILKSPTIAEQVPFTSKSLPLHSTQQAQQQSQVQTQTYATAVSTGQYAQPMFMATSSGILLNTALPTVITSHLSGLHAITQSTAIPALYPYNQNTENILPGISTLLQNHHHNPHTFVSTNSSYQLQTATHQFQVQQQPPILSTIPSTPISTYLRSKMPQPSLATSVCASPESASFCSSMPALVTSTPTTSVTSACMSPKETTPILKPLANGIEMPELTKIALNVDTALPTVPLFIPSQDFQSKCFVDILCSPTVPSLSPRLQSPPPCLPSPKSLVLEKIQQKKREGLETNIDIRKSFHDYLRPAIVDTEFQTASLPECAKSPILSQPKTIRFPALGSNGVRMGIRKSDGRIIGVCYWDECDAKYDTSSKLLDHLQTQHVNSQTGPFTCQWSGCKVHGRESCSRRWLERHVLSHGGSKQFKCIVDGCGIRFGSQLALQKHVNGHFTTVETKEPTARRSDPPVPKKLRLSGKKLRYRRQPFSARRFDFFDCGIMEGLQHRLAHTNTITKGPGGAVTFTGNLIARRLTLTGISECLIQWNPSNIISDEWIATPNNSSTKPTKTIKIQSLSASEHIALQRYLRHSYGNTDLLTTLCASAKVATQAASTLPTKKLRKPPKSMPS